MSTATSASQTLLILGDQSSLADSAAYIAVSYFWQRPNLEWFTDRIEQPIPIFQAGVGKRPSTVPPDVLHRSVAYAKHRDINAIWIDQECINQDDYIEKEHGIQTMDIVYQASRQPIAILQYCFKTQIELNVFSSLFGRQDEAYTLDKIEVLRRGAFRCFRRSVVLSCLDFTRDKFSWCKHDAPNWLSRS